MGRLLYIFLSLLIFVVTGCNSDTGVDDGANGGGAAGAQVCFSAGITTRGATAKESWTVGDKVAIFVADENGEYTGVPYCYQIVSQDGAMEPDGQAIYNDGVALSFCAFSPYDVALSSYDDYVALGQVTNSSADCLFCDTTLIDSGSVSFQFEHIYSLLTFNFMWGYKFSDDNTFSAYLNIGESKYELDVVDMSASVFVVPTTQISDATLSISVTSIVPSIDYSSDLSSVVEITEWVKGQQHNYTNIVIGTADLNYNTTTQQYEIYSALGMCAFSDLVNGQPQRADVSVSGAIHSFGVSNADIDAKLMNNIDMSQVCSRVLATNWNPIGKSVSYKFEGSFDGNNKILYQLYIEDGQSDNQALFGYISGAEIRDLGLVEGLVTSDNWCVGGLVAYATGGSVIRGCYYTGWVNGSYTVGGLVGQANGAIIISSYCVADVYATDNYVGGLVGQVASGGVVMYGCYSGGDVDCQVPIGDKGGIIGEVGSGATILLDGCYFWYGSTQGLESVGDANNTLNVFQDGYSLSELNSADTVSDLNSAVSTGASALSIEVTHSYVEGITTPEFILNR